jgi:hypothetical protein
MIRKSLGVSVVAACILLAAGCSNEALQSFNNGVNQFNSAVGIAPVAATATPAAPAMIRTSQANSAFANDPKRVAALDEILQAYADSASGASIESGCTFEGTPKDVSFYLKRANSEAKLGQDIPASPHPRPTPSSAGSWPWPRSRIRTPACWAPTLPPESTQTTHCSCCKAIPWPTSQPSTRSPLPA